jgi:hypothetical protein
MGLLGGLTFEPVWAGPALIALLVAAVFCADHPAVLGRYRHQTMTLDAAYTDEAALIEQLERLLDADVCHIVVHHVDQVRDTTTVDVRFRQRMPATATLPAVSSPAAVAVGSGSPRTDSR